MKKQAFNPYLPSYEYIPDGEAHVFGDRVYIFGSHDRFNGVSFCLNDYVSYSAPVDDLTDWRYEGVIYRKTQDGKKYKSFMDSMFAPDVCRGADGRYYLYYFIGFNSLLSVAVCDEPAGKYEFLGFIRYADGTTVGSRGEPLQFDPGVFTDNDGRTYLYSGFGPLKSTPVMHGNKPTVKGAMCFELEDDMLTVKEEAKYIGVPAKRGAKGTSYEGHEFFEASSLRKFGDKYYFVYSSYLGHELCYATSGSPIGPFSFGGTLISNGDIGVNGYTDVKNAADFTGNTHGSIELINGEYYVFYHRQTNRHQFSRQACAEKLEMRADGGFNQAERTSCGLNGKPLSGIGEYEARIACALIAPYGNRFYGIFRGLKGREPYFTQTGGDRDENPDQYIANFCNNATVGWKYFDLEKTKTIGVTVRGTAKGVLHVYDSEDKKTEIAIIPIIAYKSYRLFSAPIKASSKGAIFMRFTGSGRMDIDKLILK